MHITHNCGLCVEFKFFLFHVDVFCQLALKYLFSYVKSEVTMIRVQ